MVNTPIPHSLKSEAKKAAKILREFTIPNAKTGPDKLIPAGIFAKAKGLAILTVVKMGFLVTARGGSGIVIAKLRWSAPSAIGIAGLGGGFEIGAEVTDFVIVLTSRTAVDAFSKGGNLTLGGNFTIAAGPLGRNLEADVAMRSPAAIYTYSKTKGIFAGISVEGSALIERKDANRKFYGESIRAHQILSGEVESPSECTALYDVLKEHRELALEAAAKLAKKQALKHSQSSFRNSGENKPGRPQSSYTSTSSKTVKKDGRTITTKKKVKKVSSSYDGTSDDVIKAVADYDFEGQIPADLSFKQGEEIVVLTKTDKSYDWWEGLCNGQIGIFPANYVTIVAETQPT
ncbi:hypothetical protein LOTGIDRAFT_141887 [Lottia gigantea]|uniref:SH3 domain-containing YSC84-like protein 1 n=1 Tax=Lottia gigantea TaxID=225164 RepID=V4AQR2_LOTGI|nr:hypothetical protein LOTGIDRAFT_141887 [Lottia gigantea]ESO99582.1 hypothetical protein LOTGIDRAFT_141887 [Lottia gigantea]